MMYRMTMWKQCDGVKGVTHNNEPRENLQLTSAFHNAP